MVNLPITPIPTIPTMPAGEIRQQQQQQNQQNKQQGKIQQQQAQKAADQAKPKNPFKRTFPAQLKKGNLCLFNYLYHKHDAYPMLLVSSVYTTGTRAGQIGGINLHYLTYKYIYSMIKSYCDKSGFSYQNIKGDPFIVNSFRTYKREGMRNVRIIDCGYLLNILGRIRSFNPNEVQAIREEIDRQLNRKTNQQANIFPDNNYNLSTPQQDARKNPTGMTPIE